MKQTIEIEDCMIEAIRNIEDYITQTTGTPPAPEEIAAALSKYFVLKEILGFVELSRQGKA